MSPEPRRDVAIVAIGRNEGERLKGCLRSALEAARTVVYVDSGSTDGSPAYARSLGCTVMELDASRPFSAARARNEGFACVLKNAPHPASVQFIDGDCALAADWLERGVAAFADCKDAGVVCGHVREIHPEATVYNKLCDLEWQRTPGEIGACGGIFMVRTEVFSAAGGFRSEVIAAEDDEFCVRVRQQGVKVLLLDTAMVGHDAAMTSFSQWWRRARRTGHAYAQVAALHGGGSERYFVRERSRIWIWGLALPAVSLVAAPFTYGLSLAAMLFAYTLQLVHIYRGVKRRGWRAGDAWLYAFFTVISRFPSLQGLLAYHWRQGRGHAMTIMEHKGSS